MLDFEIFLDKGDSPPGYCHQSVYGIYERKIMNTYIKVLEDNDWIFVCVGHWVFLLLLANKPHQEGFKNIKKVFGVYV